MPFTHTGGTAGRAGTLAMQQKIGKLRKHITELEQVVVERNRHIKQLKDKNEKLRAENENLIANYKMLSDSYMDSRQACEHLFTDLKRYKSLLRSKLPERELMLIDEIQKLLELAKYAILCSEMLCSEGDIRCVSCPYHDEANSLMICKIRADAIELGVEL